MGKSHGLPVDFPLNQSIGNARVSQMESQISPPPEFSSGLHLSRVAPGVSWRMNSRFSAGYVLRAVATWEFQHSPPNKFRVLRGFEEFWGTGHDFLCYWSPPHPPIQGSWKWCVPRRGPQGVNRRVPPPIGMGSDSQGISHWVSQPLGLPLIPQSQGKQGTGNDDDCEERYLLVVFPCLLNKRTAAMLGWLEDVSRHDQKHDQKRQNYVVTTYVYLPSWQTCRAFSKRCRSGGWMEEAAVNPSLKDG